MRDFLINEITKAVSLTEQMLADEDLHATVEEIAKAGVAAIRRGGKVMFAGNGGSAADSQHLAAELVSRLAFDRPGLPSQALTTDSSILTAVGNDYGYEEVFARQVQACGSPGDLLIGISTSARSKNIIAAFTAAREKDIGTAGFTGKHGRDMSALCDHLVRIPSEETQKIQEGHIIVGHIICGLIEREMFVDQR